MGTVLLAWAGVGKSVLGRKYPEVVADMESSLYQWKGEPSEADKGRIDRVKNPLYPDNYILAIQEAMRTHPLVCVALKREVAEALRNKGISFLYMYPPTGDMELYLKRYMDRGNSPSFYAKTPELWEQVEKANEDESGQTIILPANSHLEAYLRSSDNRLGIRLPN